MPFSQCHLALSNSKQLPVIQIITSYITCNKKHWIKKHWNFRKQNMTTTEMYWCLFSHLFIHSSSVTMYPDQCIWSLSWKHTFTLTSNFNLREYLVVMFVVEYLSCCGSFRYYTKMAAMTYILWNWTRVFWSRSELQSYFPFYLSSGMATLINSACILPIELMGMMESQHTLISTEAVTARAEGQPEDDSFLQPPLVQSIIRFFSLFIYSPFHLIFLLSIAVRKKC